MYVIIYFPSVYICTCMKKTVNKISVNLQLVLICPFRLERYLLPMPAIQAKTDLRHPNYDSNPEFISS